VRTVRAVVTGAAGFIGSHAAEAMARAGHEVVAVDAPARSASPAAARTNWASLADRPGVHRVEADLAVDDLTSLARADVVVHLAGRPGVRSSWGAGRAAAVRDNVTATRRLLAACAAAPAPPRVVVASSSSVYGSAGGRPNTERDPLRPASPYAASKVATERLAARAAARGLPTVVLRYFSVYGPRQRPDMAFHRFIEAGLAGRPLPVFGDGGQSRAFTHVDDVVAATVAAATTGLPPGTVLNVGHAAYVRVRDAIGLLAGLLGVRPRIDHRAAVPGDATRTWADSGEAARLLGWSARIDLAEGLADQVAWHRRRRAAGPGSPYAGGPAQSYTAGSEPPHVAGPEAPHVAEAPQVAGLEASHVAGAEPRHASGAGLARPAGHAGRPA
jgi:nucleoside-diphosphate-sugar epimerase